MHSRIAAFGYAFQGIGTFFNSGVHAIIHAVVFLIVLIAAWWFHISALEWCAVIGISALVITLEVVNTCVEKLCDLIEPNQHPVIRQIKDMAAAAVLIAAISSVAIACCVFLPKVIELFN